MFFPKLLAAVWRLHPSAASSCLHHIMSKPFHDGSNSDEEDAMLAIVNPATIGSSSAASGSAGPSAPVPEPVGRTMIFNKMPTPATADALIKYLNFAGPKHPMEDNSGEESDKCTETTDDQSKLSNSKPECEQKG